jgi:hypothetical protein
LDYKSRENSNILLSARNLGAKYVEGIELRTVPDYSPAQLKGIAMSDHVDQTVSAFLQKLGEHERAITKIKTSINQVLELDGRPPMFAEPDEVQGSLNLPVNIRNDQFFGKPLATCVKTILEARAAIHQGAASVDELFEGLMEGGFDFEEKAESLCKRNLAISLGKNMLFQRTPKGLWGLRAWYGGTKPKGRGPTARVTTDAIVTVVGEALQKAVD